MNKDAKLIAKEAFEAATAFVAERFQRYGQKQFNCGFAWVKLVNVRSKTAKAILQALQEKDSGVTVYKDEVGHSVWCHAGFNYQDVSILKAGADAFARVLEQHGMRVSVEFRLD